VTERDLRAEHGRAFGDNIWHLDSISWADDSPAELAGS
jgi:hypothetical protein